MSLIFFLLFRNNVNRWRKYILTLALMLKEFYSFSMKVLILFLYLNKINIIFYLDNDDF
jgi:hypothetical protein